MRAKTAVCVIIFCIFYMDARAAPAVRAARGGDADGPIREGMLSFVKLDVSFLSLSHTDTRTRGTRHTPHVYGLSPSVFQRPLALRVAATFRCVLLWGDG